ncbi:MAG: GNAT family N-acetyltransferase [Chloroflexi bacterium]|nr:MAG: GNAT family N-acetyltransferase [Chloroflexota bacterium]MBL1194964.1 GNAT family N-acetyltransferase [Chloroflexota bacterium]NOH12254.1 GNAT family N-acetyltransferase [Chloroflexota bacterium]
MDNWLRRKLFQYFNLPMRRDDPYIEDRAGRRFYYDLSGEPVNDIWYWYKGRPRARIQLVWRPKQVLRLADIVIHDRKFRGQGLGTAMFQQLLVIARTHDVRAIIGHIVNTEGPSIARQQHFYSEQGCTVEEEMFYIKVG